MTLAHPSRAGNLATRWEMQFLCDMGCDGVVVEDSPSEADAGLFCLSACLRLGCRAGVRVTE